GNTFSRTGINFSGKSFTVEGWFKRDSGSSGYSLWSLSGTNMSVQMQQDGRSLNLDMGVPGSSSISVSLPALLTLNEFNHIALVVDSESDIFNISILLDGKVVYSRGIRIACRSCVSNLTFNLGSQYTTFDEVRISKIARKKFNIGNGSGPSVGLVGVTAGSTVYTNQPTFNVQFADESSINQASMSLSVNGVIDNTLSKTVSGTTGVLAGALGVPLQNGTNEIIVRGKNQNGYETVKTFLVYYITPGPTAAYSPQTSTIGLWHFNAGSILQDSSGRSFNWSGISSPGVITGIFAEGLNLWTATPSVSTSATARPATTSWTFETWLMKNGASSSYAQSFDAKQFLSVSSTGAVTYGYGTTGTTDLSVLPLDGKYHHIAVIFDASNPYRQTLLVVDGVVVSSLINTSPTSMVFSTGSGSWSYSRLDEMRLSTGAQYTLNFQRPSPSVFKNAHKMMKLR
ncbi:MAG: LamG-like jellyroll fold domain-containing protein, partial [Bdellovibrio sp.]